MLPILHLPQKPKANGDSQVVENGIQDADPVIIWYISTAIERNQGPDDRSSRQVSVTDKDDEASNNEKDA